MLSNFWTDRDDILRTKFPVNKTKYILYRCIANAMLHQIFLTKVVLHDVVCMVW